MIHKPEIQAKAHAELDAAIGEDRSPTWEDFESLPYIRQIQKETLRWRPVLPIGVAHRLEKGASRALPRCGLT
jgi:cytochrome P450